MPSQTHDALERAWKSTCKILFGQDIGGLSGYREWLCEYVTAPGSAKSSVSGKPVSLGSQDYAPGSRFASLGELDLGRKFEPLSINDVKDIDSIVEAVGERFSYAGGIVLGNSKFVEHSANVIDSNFVSNSSVVSDSKYVSDSYMIRKCEHVFGVQGDAESAFIIKSADGHKGKRQFECFTTLVSTDCYYCMRCQDSREMFFCFGSRSKSYCIGNMQLPKDKYLAIKSKLVSEIASQLAKERRIFSLLEVIEKARADHAPELGISMQGADGKGDMGPIEDAFSRTSALLLGKELRGIDKYRAYMERHVRQRLESKSPFSGKKTYISCFLAEMAGLYDVHGAIVREEEMLEVGKHEADRKMLGSISMDSSLLADGLHRIAYVDMNDTVGNNRNLIECSLTLNSEDCYRTDACSSSKKCAYSFWPRESERIFGSWAAWESSFCMKAFQSKRMTRSFEADICDSCSELYFSHNCENVNDSMFCFNTKNKRHAIGNSEFSREDYMKAKPAILAQLAGELERTKGLKWDIFSLGAQ